MFNGIKVVVVMIAVSIFVCGAVYAQNASSVEQKKETVVDAGNKICPVLDGAVNGKDYYEYKGKRYGLCCSMCKSAFANDPEKFAAIADKEAKGK